ncbi:MAG: AI-2E family transporter [Nanoarchaeota archaeon]|nr:AI-2E family transporter [Nanoarchaeota archaeon]
MVKETSLRKYLAFFVTAALAVVVLWALLPFAKAMFAGLIIVALFSPLNNYLVNKHRLNRKFSSILIIILSIILIITPLFLILYFVGVQAQSIIQNPEQISTMLETVGGLFPQLALQERVKTFIPELGTFLIQHTVKIFSKLGNLILNLIVMYFLVYYILSTKKDTRWKYVKFASPFNEKNTLKLRDKFIAVSNTTIKSTVIIAIIQGVLIAISFLIFGIPGAFLFGFAAVILSFLPVVGVFIVWVPVAAFLLIQKSYFTAIGIIVTGLIISNIDNFLRPHLQKRGAGKMHPFTTLLGVIMGIKAFGLIGLIIGPLLLTFLILTIEMFKEEYVN